MMRFALLLSFGLSASAFAQQCGSNSAPLQVTVVDERNAPVPAASVDWNGYSGGTDNRGTITFCPSQNGMAHVPASAPGYLPTSTEAWPGLGQTTVRLTRATTLPPAGSVFVLVEDPSGAVVPDAVVTLWQAKRPAMTARTARQGYAAFAGVAADDARLEVKAFGFAPTTVHLQGDLFAVVLRPSFNDCEVCVTPQPQMPTLASDLHDVIACPYPSLSAPTIVVRYVRPRRRSAT